MINTWKAELFKYKLSTTEEEFIVALSIADAAKEVKRLCDLRKDKPKALEILAMQEPLCIDRDLVSKLTDEEVEWHREYEARDKNYHGFKSPKDFKKIKYAELMIEIRKMQAKYSSSYLPDSYYDKVLEAKELYDKLKDVK